VRFVASTKPSHELPKDDGANSTRTANKDARPGASPAVKTRSSQDSITNSIGMTLKLIPAGEFMMGSPDSDQGAYSQEKPQHRVRISKSFYLGVYEVTQAEYKAVMENNPGTSSPNGDGKDKVAGQSTDQYPMEGVSWFDAVIFCNKLSAKEGRRPFYEIDDKYVQVPDWNGPGYRLPTEAEWEYACRANASTPTRYSFGDDAAQLDEYGWFQANSSRIHPVGKKKPNGFGLYDMHGNVEEWCWDWYGEDYYKQSREDDPTGPAGRLAPSLCRVIRGGCSAFGPEWVRSADRDWTVPASTYSNGPGHRVGSLGFRLAVGPSGR
jgi:formylglycine-generating enzyme required for sulfatase activity